MQYNQPFRMGVTCTSTMPAGSSSTGAWNLSQPVPPLLQHPLGARGPGQRLHQLGALVDHQQLGAAAGHPHHLGQRPATDIEGIDPAHVVDDVKVLVTEGELLRIAQEQLGFRLPLSQVLLAAGQHPPRDVQPEVGRAGRQIVQVRAGAHRHLQHALSGMDTQLLQVLPAEVPFTPAYQSRRQPDCRVVEPRRLVVRPLVAQVGP